MRFVLKLISATVNWNFIRLNHVHEHAHKHAVWLRSELKVNPYCVCVFFFVPSIDDGTRIFHRLVVIIIIIICITQRINECRICVVVHTDTCRTKKEEEGGVRGGAKGSGRHTFGDTYAHIRVYAALVACRVIRFVTPKINMFLLGILRDPPPSSTWRSCVFVCLCTCLRFSSLQEGGRGNVGKWRQETLLK